MEFHRNMKDEEFKEFLKTVGRRTSSQDDLRKALQEEGYPYYGSVCSTYTSSGPMHMGMAMAWAPSGSSVSVGF